MGRPGENYTTVDELVPPLLADGSYAQPAAGQAYLPTAPTWRYTADPPSSFYADHISGAQRLPNGNTLVCDGTHGRFFEVTAAGETVWENDVGDVEVFRVTRIQTSDARLDPLLERQGRVLLPLLLRVYSANDAA